MIPSKWLFFPNACWNFGSAGRKLDGDWLGETPPPKLTRRPEAAATAFDDALAPTPPPETSPEAYGRNVDGGYIDPRTSDGLGLAS